ncbi:phage holin family protein [Luteolibacter sp. Populi]|uniref:phage holin family protein n=1 Tax=Luteolibacter sp. Populi TaxID=3230487 RepID=UPI0034667774
MSESPEAETPVPPNWRESALEFVAARLELASLEAKEAGKYAALRAALVLVIGFCAVVAWLAIVAGLVGWIASNGVAWYFIALGAAFLHLLVAGIAVAILRRPVPPAFPHTKAELSKDREWLLKKNQISKR